MNFQWEYVPRRLSWTDRDGEKRLIPQDALLTDYKCPLVILGEPGMGKTWLMDELGKSQGCKLIKATKLLRQPESLISDNSRLVIDGLDEVAAVEAGDPLHNILKKLISCGKPPFVISCRSAEWRGATARLDVESEYGEAPKVLELEPFSDHEADQILAREVGRDKARESIVRLRSGGLETFFQNPLNLGFLATILKEEGNLPETRADLLERAVSALCRENRTPHSNNVLGMLSEEDSLDVAGCLMATILITGKDGITKTKAINKSLFLSDISDMTDFRSANAVLGSRLFHHSVSTNPDGVDLFFPIHRTVAEFLGARWLASKVKRKENRNQFARRLLGLLSSGGGVPASLRGLHAWLPKFSDEWLGSKVIDRDAYGILRYGDGDNLSSTQAEMIIGRLRDLGYSDPYFWWENLSIKGLVHTQLTEMYRSIIRDYDEPSNLRSLLLEAIKGNEISESLKSDLHEIILDTNYEFRERKKACTVIVRINDPTFDWPAVMERLFQLCDDASAHLAVEIIPKIGIEKFSDKQIANAVLAHSGIFQNNSSGGFHHSYISLDELAKKIPNTRIRNLLDELTREILPYRNPDKWWDLERDKGNRVISQFTRNLIFKLLSCDSDSIGPGILWSWIHTLWREGDKDIKGIYEPCRLIGENDRLRHGIQRIALFSPGTEDEFLIRKRHLIGFCEKLDISNEDALIHLSELVERKNPEERFRWEVLVEQFREENSQLVPKGIQEIAFPYAANDKRLIYFLTKKPKPTKLSDSEKKYKRRMRDRERRWKKRIEEERELYRSHIDLVRQGELKWILYPAQAYLGMFSDLPADCDPYKRISDWLGSDIGDASLIGFEAVLNRTDIPSARQISEEYANSRVWNYVYPMLVAAGERHLNGKGFHDLSYDQVSALTIIAENEIPNSGEHFQGLREALTNRVREDSKIYETHLRTMFEPMLELKNRHIRGLFRFTREDDERPLSTQLSLEWLKKYPEIPLEVKNELINCVIRTPKEERQNDWTKLSEITENKLDKLAKDEDKTEENKAWRSLQFLIKFDVAIIHIPDITEENRDWLWSLTNWFYSYRDYGRKDIPVTISQLNWLVKRFRHVWPKVARPTGVMVGITNPWNATEFIEWAIYQIGKDPSKEASLALAELRDMPDDGYTDHILSAIAQNDRVQVETNFRSPSLAEIKAVLKEESPKTSADVQAIALEKLSVLQEKLRGDSLNPVNNFYDDQGKPRTEGECRDQMMIAIGDLPFGIRFSAEVSMPQGRRSDGVFAYGEIEVPLEIKGQWHKDVWTAANSQLDRYYCVSHRSASKGIYVVFWFGNNVPNGKRLKLPPDGRKRPRSTEEMRISLQSLIPSSRRSDIEIVVMDVTRP